MATIATSPIRPPAERIPPLENGDHLTRAEFERRYDATPGLTKAELIEGIVYMAPPVSHVGHSKPHSYITTWLCTYHAATPGTSPGDNGSIRMDTENMPQPDAALFILPPFGKQAWVNQDDYVEGAPELIIEVSSSSASFDLHRKRAAYLRNGVREYIVWRTFDKALDYFILRGSEYVRHSPDDQGRYKSIIFPGLWLDSLNLLKGDLATVLKFVQEGIASPEHAEFVAKLQSASESK